MPNQTTVPATSAELLLLWFCGARNAVVKEVAEDKLNISLFPLIRPGRNGVGGGLGGERGSIQLTQSSFSLADERHRRLLLPAAPFAETRPQNPAKV